MTESKNKIDLYLNMNSLIIEIFRIIWNEFLENKFKLDQIIIKLLDCLEVLILGQYFKKFTI